MKKFKFKLEAHLTLKKIDERRKMADLAIVVAEITKERDQVDKFFNESQRLLQAESKNMRAGIFNQIYYRDMQRYFYALEKKRVIAEKNIEGFQEDLAMKQTIANDARRKRKVIEKLREKKKMEHAHLVKVEETKQLDEFNSSRSRGIK